MTNEVFTFPPKSISWETSWTRLLPLVQAAVTRLSRVAMRPRGDKPCFVSPNRATRVIWTACRCSGLSVWLKHHLKLSLPASFFYFFLVTAATVHLLLQLVVLLLVHLLLLLLVFLLLPQQGYYWCWRFIPTTASTTVSFTTVSFTTATATVTFTTATATVTFTTATTKLLVLALLFLLLPLLL